MNRWIIFIPLLWSATSLSKISCELHDLATDTAENGTVFKNVGFVTAAKCCPPALSSLLKKRTPADEATGADVDKGKVPCFGYSPALCGSGVASFYHGHTLNQKAEDRRQLASQLGDRKDCFPPDKKNPKGTETCEENPDQSHCLRTETCEENPDQNHCQNGNNDDNDNNLKFGGSSGGGSGNDRTNPRDLKTCEENPNQNICQDPKDICKRYNLICATDSTGNLKNITTPDGKTIYPPTPENLGVSSEEFDTLTDKLNSFMESQRQKIMKNMRSFQKEEQNPKEEILEEDFKKRSSTLTSGKRRNKNSKNKIERNKLQNKKENKYSKILQDTLEKERSPQSLPYKAQMYGKDKIGNVKDNLFEQASRVYEQIQENAEIKD